MTSTKSIETRKSNPAPARLNRGLCRGLGLAVMLFFTAAPVAADEVCDFLRKKIVWNYAVAQVAKSQSDDWASRLESVVPDDGPRIVYESLWLDLYVDSKCSSRQLAEDLLKADDTIVAQRNDSFISNSHE